jgi:hypothetical protein
MTCINHGLISLALMLDRVETIGTLAAIGAHALACETFAVQLDAAGLFAMTHAAGGVAGR